MAEGITIPSPSVFLRQTPPPSIPATEPSPKPSKTPVRRSSKETKKTAHKKGAQSTLVTDGSVVKPKQSKSRNGCVTCKAKRLKCGEEKPTCHQCARRNVECGGYKKDFKWRPFEETNIKFNIERQKQATSPRHPLPGNSSKTTNQPIAAQLVSPETSQDCDDNTNSDRCSPFEDSDVYRPQQTSPLTTSPRHGLDTPPPSSVFTSPPEEHPDPAPPPPNELQRRTSQASITASMTPPSQPAAITSIPARLQGNSPTLTEILHPLPDLDAEDCQDFVSLSLPEDIQLPLLASESDPDMMDSDLLALESGDLIDADDSIDLATAIWSPELEPPSFLRGQPPMDSSLALWQNQLNYMYQQPSIPQDSIESLTLRFDRMTCGILSVMDGPSENPWRTLVWPLTQQSPALFHAVAAMTAFHSSADVPALRIKGAEHKQASIRYVREGIRDNSISDEIAIGTALALGFSESWDHHTATGNTHIKGAQILVRRALARHHDNPLKGVELARLKFLCNAWVYMDVIARLTSFDSDASSVDFDNTFLFTPEAPQMVMGADAPGFGIDFGMPIDARLDPLMGCANTLFPLIGRVANLVRRVWRSQTNSPAVISQANDLKKCLELWGPPEFIERPEDPSTDVEHTLQTAEAYRYATLLHLHQAVPEIPSVSSAELAVKVLQYLATIPLTSRTVIVHIYPLMVAGSEVSDPENRQWVSDRWASMGQRMRIGVIDKCITVTEEVWRRRQAYESQPRSRGRVVATADLQGARHPRETPFGNGRRPSDFLSADPGRTGMVFSYVDLDGDGNMPAVRPRINIPDQRIGPMDIAYTVRGHLHWIGVMYDWQWEGESFSSENPPMTNR